MRVAHLTATFPPYLGGAGTAAFHLADGLAGRGHHVEVFTAAAKGAPPRTAAHVHRLKPRFAIGNAPLLPELLRLRGFDVVHLHLPFIFGADLTLLSRLRSRVPLVVSYHNKLVGEGLRAPLFAGYEATVGRAALAAAARVLVVSDAHAETVPALRRLRAWHPERVVAVPNGVDTGVFAPGDRAAARADLDLPDDVPVAAFVAALDRAHFLKCPELAIEAVARSGIDDLHLVIAGDGEDRPALEARARAAGLDGRAHFLGAVAHDRLPEVLRAADVLLLTSELESFGIVLLEAMACGVPPVAFGLPGVTAVVEHGRTGLLAPPGDAAALALTMRAMLESPETERAAMAAAGRATCQERYAWPRIVDQVQAVYAEVVR